MKTPQANVGDKVTWMKVTKKGSVTDIETKGGTILDVSYTIAKILPTGKKKAVFIPVKDLRLASEKSQLLELVEAVFGENRKKLC